MTEHIAHDVAIEVIDFPGYQIRLERYRGESESDPQVQTAALGAIFAAASSVGCTPLSIDYSLAYWDDELDFPHRTREPNHPHWFLRSDSIASPTGIVPVWQDAVTQVVRELDYDTTGDVIANSIASEASGEAISVEELIVRSSTVRLPAGVVPDSAVSIPIRYGWKNTINYPVESHQGKYLVSGPRGVILNAPIEFRMTRDVGRTLLDISIFWSLWTPGSGSYEILRNCLSELGDDGWFITDEG